MLAYDRAGPTGRNPIVLLHAGIADRRMWNPQWAALTAERDAIRLDLPGFGESAEKPRVYDPLADVLAALEGVPPFALVGASFGAGVAVELALAAPSRVTSLLLSAPGGSLIAEVTPGLRAFWDAENAAVAAGDFDAAVMANLDTWVPGADPAVREQVGVMQRRAFEVTDGWDDLEEVENDPLPRLGEIAVPTTVLVGTRDIDATQATARSVAAAIPGARLVEWEGVTHLPSMERPAEFLALLRDQR
ncbi:alpha/beta fold hydrolase [Solirubrobacter soli]|uniref:alpha/beta fold hydrolase n=1 Tax=Solirubrobacter soli TaxID=363832 RepID=UPI00040D0C41|nr:alpha/beta fold hydrolase [Solirubrobacter soli]